MKPQYFNQVFAVTALSVALLISGCNDDNDNSIGQAQPVGVVTSAKEYANATTTPFTQTSETISYSMPKVNGGTTTATAVVLIPKGTAPAGGWPVIAWGHGTTGVADQCAPSNPGANLAGYAPLLAEIVKAGYAVVAPDYEGLGSAGIHPFLNADSEGRSVIYAVKAARDKYSLSSRWMAAGHSQGGHAAIAAAERASVIGLDFKGTVAFAPASNLDSIILGGYNAIGQAFNNPNPVVGVTTAKTVLPGLQAFSALTVAGIRESHANFNYMPIFTSSRSAQIAQTAEQNCLDVLGQSFAADINTFYNDQANSKTIYPGLDVNFKNDANIKEFLEASRIAKAPISQPLLILQGQLDTTVPAQITQLLQSQLSGQITADKLSVVYNPTADHTSIVNLEAPRMLQFIGQNMPVR